ncbi:pentatricopeptide repeat-containing protein At4g13650 isoform X2 [Impatiens glandulifera]|uniref:pentatricopeptide repeat-containing protein At4g13650 isoform X2 n=1 Tax=Impatiens glandulifera TaxID=253017 RepID=UPI001FB179B7|nr:pentatricopeptide repeat-containing protein At4g13650 isoform X2 [Impatiens glandulifera]
MVTRIEGFIVKNSFFSCFRHSYPRPTNHQSLRCASSNAVISQPFEEWKGINGNHQTYVWLLDGCVKSGTFLNIKKLHSKILKSGFLSEHVVYDRLLNSYIAFDKLDYALQLLHENTDRSLFSWNALISAFVHRKLHSQALRLFSQMLEEEHLKPDETTFSCVLKASNGDKFSLKFVEQLQAIIIRLGFYSCSLVCNPLIDLYSKNGFVNSAKLVFQQLPTKDSVSWLAMLSGLSQNGLERDAIDLYNEMQESGFIPTPYIFSSIISACTKIELYPLGEQLHALVFKWAFASETYVCNSLVTLYARSENFVSAEQIFGKMKCRDEVSYNSLISGLAQQGFSEKALQLFEEMQVGGLKPDCVTIASLLSACASTGDLLKGVQLHSYAVKAGLLSDIIIEEKRNVVLWNVMLVAYGQIGNLVESSVIYSRMLSEGLRPNEYTYPSILRTCTLVGALDLGKQIHTQVVKTGFQPNVYVCSVLIDMYAKLGKLDIAHQMLRRIPEDLVSWTALIAGYTQHDKFSEALKLFEEMNDRGIRSDNIGLSSAISACAGIPAFNQGRQIHAQSIVSGYSLDLSIGNALVSLYSRCGKMEDAYLAFSKIVDKDSISWNGLLSGFAQSGLYEEALGVFRQMNQSGVGFNMFTYCPAVSAAANMANVKQGKQIHARMVKTGCDYETEASNVLITLYAKCGNLNDSKRLFLEMSERNEISWNAMITGYSQHGCGLEALEIFREMNRVGVSPNHVTFVGVLSACSHVGMVDEGIRYFESMTEEHRLIPKAEHYVCVVDILGRAGYLQRAKEFVESMKIEPDAMIWRTLLSACTVHKNFEIGEFAANRLLELEPNDSATYVLLSNMYAVSGKWNWRDKIRQTMKSRGVKKEAGRSWIEVKNSIHAFFVGDRLHPMADKIYEFLEELNERAIEVGYIRESNSLLNEIDRAKKDLSMYVHSEKLAIAFGLISLSSSDASVPLMVMKNLRVCSDCHNWIKCVSEVSKRTIIVRDAYRFHHFEKGACSCKDFW